MEINFRDFQSLKTSFGNDAKALVIAEIFEKCMQVCQKQMQERFEQEKSQMTESLFVQKGKMGLMDRGIQELENMLLSRLSNCVEKIELIEQKVHQLEENNVQQ